ncbi:MAG: protein phosphatase 2C domain-containing protein [Paracoccaceae bacterium]
MSKLVADAVTAIDVGRRKRQEDAVVADFSQGSEVGLAVLSDGMGGHDDGDLASRILVSEMFGELFFSGARPDAMMKDAKSTLQDALDIANKRLKNHSKSGNISGDTGGTLVSIAVIGQQLRWISVGDSPLYLLRDGNLHRLNEDHSMAPQIDLMVSRGVMDEETARNHPQRNCLTSAITGGKIARIDCPDTGLTLMQDDVVILASDGINVLPDGYIRDIVDGFQHTSSENIADELMKAVHLLDVPDQDNISLVVIKMNAAQEPERNAIAVVLRGFANSVRGQRQKLSTLARQVFTPNSTQVRS